MKSKPYEIPAPLGEIMVAEPMPAYSFAPRARSEEALRLRLYEPEEEWKGKKVLTREEIRRNPEYWPDVEYPPEVIARWDRISKEMDEQIAAGELPAMTIHELTAHLGVADDWKNIDAEIAAELGLGDDWEAAWKAMLYD